MMIASTVTDNEDVLIACILHDILEDVALKHPDIYNEQLMRQDFGDKVTNIVKDVTHDDSIYNWHKRKRHYLDHLLNHAQDEAIIVSACDKIHNLLTIVEDYKLHGQKLARRFKFNSLTEQVWFYKETHKVLYARKAPKSLLDQYDHWLTEIQQLLAKDS